MEYVYVVSIVNVDFHDDKYVCKKLSDAERLFYKLIDELIKETEENIPRWRECGCDTEILVKDIEFLKIMKPGDTPPHCMDHPSISKIPFIKGD